MNPPELFTNHFSVICQTISANSHGLFSVIGYTVLLQFGLFAVEV
jgi:hypothetical protein